MSETTFQLAQFVDVAAVSELSESEGRIVQAEGNWIALFLVDGIPHAIENACPHMAGPLGSGSCVKGIVTCPIHGWQFDVRTGLAPTNENLKVARFDSRVVNGRVHVRVRRTNQDTTEQ